MKNSEKIILAASLVAGTVAYFISKRKKKNVAHRDFAHFTKNRHLMPFAYMRKHS